MWMALVGADSLWRRSFSSLHAFYSISRNTCESGEKKSSSSFRAQTTPPATIWGGDSLRRSFRRDIIEVSASGVEPPPPFFEAVHVLAPRFFFHFLPLRFRHGARVLLRSFHGGQHAGLRGPFARRNRLGGRLLVARSRQRRHAFGLRGSFFQL